MLNMLPLIHSHNIQHMGKTIREPGSIMFNFKGGGSPQVG